MILFPEVNSASDALCKQIERDANTVTIWAIHGPVKTVKVTRYFQPTKPPPTMWRKKGHSH